MTSYNIGERVTVSGRDLVRPVGGTVIGLPYTNDNLYRVRLDAGAEPRNVHDTEFLPKWLAWESNLEALVE